MTSLITIFNNTISKEPEWKKSSSSKTPQFKIKPSVLGSPCLRQIYYSSAGVPEDHPFPLDGKKRMKLGDAVHSMLHDVFKEAGIIVEYYNPDGSTPKDYNGKDNTEFPLTSLELFIKKGKIDAVMIIDGELWLVEYKSINLKGFSSLMDPKSDHTIQAVTYFFVFNQHLKDGKFSHIKELHGFTQAKGIKWLYVNKDDTDLKEYSMTEADYLFKQIVEKIVTIKNFYDSKILPPKTNFYCYSCNWRDKCKKDVNI